MAVVMFMFVLVSMLVCVVVFRCVLVFVFVRGLLLALGLRRLGSSRCKRRHGLAESV